MLTREKIRTINADITAALEAVAKKHGLAVSPGRIGFDSTSFKYSTEFALADGLPQGADPKLAKNAERFGFFCGLGREKIGGTFEDPRLGVVTYIGMSSRSHAVVKTLDGKQYRYKADAASKLLAKAG